MLSITPDDPQAEDFAGIVGRVVPWSGEVIPPEVIPLPQIPVDVPVAGPIINFVGQGEHAIWNDVWGWWKSTASSTVKTLVGIEDQIIQEAVTVAEAYAGAGLQALSGFINGAYDFATATAQVALDWSVTAVEALATSLTTLYEDTYKILADVVGIDTIVIPALEAEIARLGIDTFGLVGDAITSVETWAIDNIYGPLDTLIRDVEVTIPVWAEGALTDAKAYADQLVQAESSKIAAQIAAVAAAAAAATTWIDDCGEPMCQVQGPKTDLGKFLKALAFAADAAALADLLSLTAPELAAKISETVALFGTYVATFEGYFGSGTQTLGDILNPL